MRERNRPHVKYVTNSLLIRVTWTNTLHQFMKAENKSNTIFVTALRTLQIWVLRIFLHPNLKLARVWLTTTTILTPYGTTEYIFPIFKVLRILNSHVSNTYSRVRKKHTPMFINFWNFF